MPNYTPSNAQTNHKPCISTSMNIHSFMYDTPIPENPEHLFGFVFPMGWPSAVVWSCHGLCSQQHCLLQV